MFVIERANGSFTRVRISLAGHENVPTDDTSCGIPSPNSPGGPPMQQAPILRNSARTPPPPVHSDTNAFPKATGNLGNYQQSGSVDLNLSQKTSQGVQPNACQAPAHEPLFDMGSVPLRPETGRIMGGKHFRVFRHRYLEKLVQNYLRLKSQDGIPPFSEG